MKTKKQFLSDTILYLIRSFIINNDNKKGLYLSFIDDIDGDGYYIHILLLKPASTTVNVFATATNSPDLQSISEIEQYACATGGVLYSQVDDMVKELFTKDEEFSYHTSAEFMDVDFDGECDLGAEFLFSIDKNKKITLKYM